MNGQASMSRAGPILGAVTVAVAAFVLWVVWSGLGGLAEDLVYYWSPTELVKAGEVAYTATIRLGGQVEPDSMDDEQRDGSLAFRVTDGVTTVPVSCVGATPQMLREGIGVVVEGTWSREGVFQCDKVMVKHSNEYRSPEEGEPHAERPPFETLLEESE